MFIKGTLDQPKCKFTRRLVDSIKPCEYKVKTFNILADERIRQWLKFYSNWPTFPQIYIEGQFVGGIDIVMELIEEGEFDEMIPKNCKKLPADQALQHLLTENNVLVAMHGSINEPVDAEGKGLVELMRSLGIQFAAIDVNANQELAQELQKVNKLDKISTLVYIKGELVGTYETLKKMIDDGQKDQLIKLVPAESIKQTIEQKLQSLVNRSKIILFMKGDPSAPQCGFSQRIVKILNKYVGTTID